MRALELKLPPVLVTAILALLMWGIARVTPPHSLHPVLAMAGASLFLAGGAVVGLAGILAFRRAGTTVNPLRPESSARLVVEGVYRFSRNPMYLALLMCLFAWGIALSNPWAMLAAWAFVPFMNRFQIRPEERAMLRRFGPEFQRYAARVRRWI